mgnify:CR=1 FL=1
MLGGGPRCARWEKGRVLARSLASERRVDDGAHRRRRRRPRGDRRGARARRRGHWSRGCTQQRTRLRRRDRSRSTGRTDHWIDNGQHVSPRCCTAYLALPARDSASSTSLPIQRPPRIPVLRENKPPRVPAPRTAARATAPTSCPRCSRYPLLDRRDRLQRAPRSGARCASSILADARLDEQIVRRLARRAPSSARRDAVAELWNLITLPATQPATRPRRSLGARDDGLPHRAPRLPPTRADIGDPDRARCSASTATRRPRRSKRAGVRRQSSGTPVRAGDGDELVARRRGADADAVVVAVATRGRRSARPAGSRRRRGARRTRLEPDREPARALRPPRARRAVRRRRRAARRCSGSSTAPKSSGVAARPARRRLALGRATLSIGEPRRDAARALPARARAPAAGRARRGPCSTSPRRASRARPSAPLLAPARCGPGRAPPSPGLYLAGAWTDTGWPATMESAVRSGLAAARAAPTSQRHAHQRSQSRPRDASPRLAAGRRRAARALERASTPALAPARRRAGGRASWRPT